jgi:hypothetical protein
VLEHRRNGWFLLGGSMIAGGVAWLAAWGVAVASAGPPHSLRYWDWPSYAATGVVVAGLLIVFAVMYDWLAWLPWLYPGKSGLPLKAVGGSPHYHEWNYAAAVAALPIMVTNRTRAPVTLAGGCQIRGNMGDISSWKEKLTEAETGLFMREVESQKRSSHHRPSITDRATIPAHSSLEFWYVTDVSRDQRGVHLDVTLHFKDTDGNEYSATFERIPPQQTRSKPPLPL